MRRPMLVPITALLCLVMAIAGCSADSPRPASHPAVVSATPTVTPTPTPTTTVVVETPTPTPTPTPPPAPVLTPTVKATPSPTVAVAAPAGSGPVIVIDPGHSPTISSVDPSTGLNDSDYENEPEMRDVFSVAQLVQAQLTAAGYRVVMTKTSATDRISLGQRAAVANNAHAALALSIHDQAGSNGGIGFRLGNNTVYYQSVGDYRMTPSGTKVSFTDPAVAALSARYGQIFQAQRAAAEGVSVKLLGDTGYDLGSRSLPGGDIWMVQLLSKVPWIYNEAGGNSVGQSGLNAADQQTYANALVASVEKCLPI